MFVYVCVYIYTWLCEMNEIELDPVCITELCYESGKHSCLTLRFKTKDKQLHL